MATAADYLTVEEAKIDLRLDADAQWIYGRGFGTAIGIVRSGIVSGLTGRILPDPTVDADDVDPGLKALMLGGDGNALGRFSGDFAFPLRDGRPIPKHFLAVDGSFGDVAHRFFYFPIVGILLL